MANVYLALEADLEIIPVLNKIDLPGAEPDRVKREIEDVLGLDTSESARVRSRPVLFQTRSFHRTVEPQPP